MAAKKQAKSSDAVRKPDTSQKEVTASKADSRSLYDKQLGAKQIHVDDTTVVYLPEGSPRIGHFATATAGDYKGKYGVVEKALKFDSQGWPTEVLFRLRDETNEPVTVKYKDLVESEAGHR